MIKSECEDESKKPAKKNIKKTQSKLLQLIKPEVNIIKQETKIKKKKNLKIKYNFSNKKIKPLNFNKWLLKN